MAIDVKTYQTVLVEREEGITWVTLNRPEKRNAMNPTMHYEMLEVISTLEADPDTGVLILTGAGESWCGGQDLKEYFRDLENNPAEQRRAHWAAHEWRWRRLFTFPRPTIAMVNGHCFGGGFTQLIACDFAVAAEDATFGLSEINWGVFPAGLVTRALAEVMNMRDALYYIMTGTSFDGRKAAELRLVNWAVPRERLREEAVQLARTLLGKNPNALRAAKEVYKTCKTMDFWQAEEYLMTKFAALQATDPERGGQEGIRQFIEDRSYRPGFGGYRRGGPDAGAG